MIVLSLGPWFLGLFMEMLLIASCEHSLERIRAFVESFNISEETCIQSNWTFFESLFASNMMNDTMHACMLLPSGNRLYVSSWH